MNEKLEWYVVHTYSGYENKVTQDIKKVVENRGLGNMIAEVKVPIEKVRQIDGKSIEDSQNEKAEEGTYDLSDDETANGKSKSSKKGEKVKKEKVFDRKIFPSYVFVKMILTDETWYIVRNTRGATGFVGPGSKPVPLSEAEVEELGLERDEVVQSVEVAFGVGDEVNIVGGSFDGLSGCVQSLDLEEMTAEVVVPLAGRDDTIVKISLLQLKLADS